MSSSIDAAARVASTAGGTSAGSAGVGGLPLELQEQAILASIQDLQRKLAGLPAPSMLMATAAAADAAAQAPPATTDTGLAAASQVTALPPTGRLIVVANRLPISMTRDAAGAYTFKMSSGGLVSALVSVRDRLKFAWVGWTGKESPPEEHDHIRRRLHDDFNCVPVFISDSLAEAYYNGFSNDVLWPLMHYEPAADGGQKRFPVDEWRAYREANAQFADVVLSIYKPGTRAGAGRACLMH
jgi:trehalose 6-phosphate synthase